MMKAIGKPQLFETYCVHWKTRGFNKMNALPVVGRGLKQLRYLVGEGYWVRHHARILQRKQLSLKLCHVLVQRKTDRPKYFHNNSVYKEEHLTKCVCQFFVFCVWQSTPRVQYGDMAVDINNNKPTRHRMLM